MPIILFYNFKELSLFLKISAFIILILCLFAMGESFCFTDEYLERSFFGKKRKLLLQDIYSVRPGLHLGTYIIQSNNKKFIFFILNILFQKKKRDLLFLYIKKANPNCKFG